MNFEALVDDIYEAAIYPEKWPAVLHDLSRASASAGGIILLRRSSNWIGWRFSEGLRGAREFMESDAPARSKTTERLLKFDRAGFVTDTDLFTDAEYRADSLVAEWAAPNRLHHAAATAIKTPSADLVVVQIQRDSGISAFGPADVALLDSFRPHLARAGLLAVRLQFERLHAAARALELLGLPAVIIDRAGRILSANELAETAAPHLGSAAREKLVLLDPNAQARLETLLAQGGGGQGWSFPSRPKDDALAIVHLLPVAGSARDLFEGGFYIVILTLLRQAGAMDGAILQGLFDLTPAEAAIAGQLGQGWTLDKVAEMRGSSLATIRSQVKAIFAKTNVSRQSELVALLAGIPKITG
jgi:DNA-binding CsgD family transcriptional regulator